MKRSWVAVLIVALLVACGQPTAQATPTASPHHTPTPTPSPTPVPTPTPLPPPPNLPAAAGLGVPAGFSAYVYARGLGTATAMAFGPDGRLYVLSSGGSLAVVGSAGAGPRVLLSGLPIPLGLAWRGDDLYVSVRGGVRAYHLTNGALSGGGTGVRGLVPAVSRHQNDWIVSMPNGDFLLGLGSTCDVCNEADPRSASVLRFHADWSYAGVVVRGSRNPYGLALRGSTGDAYVTINGQDNLGAQPADHLLRVTDGEDAGWPRCWPAYPDGSLHGNCAGVAPPVAVFAPHSSADGITFYDGAEFGADYADSAFVTEWGANVGGPTGRRVMRVVLSGSGASEHGQVSDFATGFSHPLAILEAPDGGLLVGDYGTGQVTEIFRTS